MGLFCFLFGVGFCLVLGWFFGLVGLCDVGLIFGWDWRVGLIWLVWGWIFSFFGFGFRVGLVGLGFYLDYFL